MKNLHCIVLLLLTLAAVPAAANDLILEPTGVTLTTGQVRAEAAFSADGSQSQYYWLGAGLKQFELNAIRYQKHGQAPQDLVNLQWGFLPETIVTPAVSFGVRDIGEQSTEGIGPYAAVTRHISMGPASMFVKDFAVTLGAGLFGIKGPFTGFQAELPGHIILQGEYDSRDLNAAIAWQPTKRFRIKGYTIRSDYYLGAELVPVTF